MKENYDVFQGWTVFAKNIPSICTLYLCILVLELFNPLILCQKNPIASELHCRQTEHFPCTFGIEIPVNLGFVLKISSWWFHPSVVIIFADYAPYDNCICLGISHHMQMLIWPITFLSSLFAEPCMKAGASSQMQPCFHTEFQLCEQPLSFPIAVCSQSSLNASNFIDKRSWVLLAYAFF